MQLFLGLLIIAAAVYATLKRVDVRLVLIVAAFLLGGIGGDVPIILRTLLKTLSNEQFVVPICSAMGFAHVLRLTGCDQHLVNLLVKPLRNVRAFLIPGAVLVGFLVNIPVISQTSTAVAIGPVLVPLLLASGISRATIGSALLLGASLGGELLNPGAPELRTVSEQLDVQATECVAKMPALLFTHLAVATLVFWIQSLWYEKGPNALEQSPLDSESPGILPDFRVNPIKAAIPILPIVLLFLTAGPRYLIPVHRIWVLDPDQDGRLFDGRLIGAAMLIGVVAAALVNLKSVAGTAKAFFEGAGYAFTNIISLIVAANCFGEGVKQIGLASQIGAIAVATPSLLVPLAGLLPLAFAWLSGSGMASTQSLFQFFTGPSGQLGLDPVRVGAVVSLGAAAGRTMSPVSAVGLMCGNLTNTSPLVVAKRVAVPLLAGMLAVILLGMVLARK